MYNTITPREEDITVLLRYLKCINMLLGAVEDNSMKAVKTIEEKIKKLIHSKRYNPF